MIQRDLKVVRMVMAVQEAVEGKVEFKKFNRMGGVIGRLCLVGAANALLIPSHVNCKGGYSVGVIPESPICFMRVLTALRYCINDPCFLR